MSIFDTANEFEIDPNKNYFEELVGEGKMYADNIALARAVAEKEAFIRLLKREKDEVRQDLDSRIRLEELTDRLARTNEDRPVVETTVDNPPELDLDAEIEKRFRAREAEQKKQNNLQSVRTKLMQDYGSNAASVLETRMRTLGVTKEFMDNIASTNPTAFFAMLGEPERKQPDVQPPRSSVASSFKPTVNGRNYAYYQNLRRTDPSTYHTPRVQHEMHMAAREMGEAFYD